MNGSRGRRGDLSHIRSFISHPLLSNSFFSMKTAQGKPGRVVKKCVSDTVRSCLAVIRIGRNISALAFGPRAP
jgi:hypothetical protein